MVIQNLTTTGYNPDVNGDDQEEDVSLSRRRRIMMIPRRIVVDKTGYHCAVAYVLAL